MTNAIPEPDTKDWTWVLAEQCPECGFHRGRRGGAGHRRRRARAGAAVGHRPGAATTRGSDPTRPPGRTLEYGAHVRDVLRIFDGRLDLLLTQDDPRFENWDQDATAVADRYDLQDPAVVSTELAEAAVVVADRFDGVTDDQWDRAGTRSNGSQFSVLTLGQYFLHDVVHHLHDVHA